MAYRCAPALLQLRDEVNYLWPGRARGAQGVTLWSRSPDGEFT